MQEAILKHYVDEVWGVYDSDKDGFLDISEIKPFFNDLYVRVGEDKTYSEEEIQDFFAKSDTSKDGKVCKDQLKNVLKEIWAKNPYMGTVKVYEEPPKGFQYHNAIVTVTTQTVIFNEYFSEVWLIYDSQNSGSLSVTQITSFVNDLFARIGGNKVYTEEQIRVFFQQANVNFEGSISRASFLKVSSLIWEQSEARKTVKAYVPPAADYKYTFFTASTGNQQVILNKYLDELWSVYDSQSSGSITITQITFFFNDFYQRIGETRVFTEQDIRAFFSQSNVNFEGTIDRQTLFKVITPAWQSSKARTTITTYEAPAQDYKYTYNITTKQNSVLNDYSSQIWRVYDSNNTGNISINQTTYFFNDLFNRVGEKRTFTEEDIRTYFNQANIKYEGNIDRASLEKVLVLVWGTSEVTSKITTYVAPSETYTYTYYISSGNGANGGNTVVNQYNDEIWRVYDSSKTGNISVNQTTYFFNDLFNRVGEKRTFTEEEIKGFFNQANIKYEGNVDRASLEKVLTLVWSTSDVRNKITTYVAPSQTYTYTYYISGGNGGNTVVNQYNDEIWRVYDSNKTGNITINQTTSYINDFFSRVGEKRTLTEQEIRAYFNQANIKYEGNIDRTSLSRILTLVWDKSDAKNTVTTYVAPINGYKYTYYVSGGSNASNIISKAESGNSGTTTSTTTITSDSKIDPVLIKYIDEIWAIYDVNQDGYLNFNELSGFFNNLFSRTGDGRSITQEQIISFFKQADVNNDQRVDRTELYRVLSLIYQSKSYSGTVTYEKPRAGEIQGYRTERGQRITTITKGGSFTSSTTTGYPGQTITTKTTYTSSVDPVLLQYVDEIWNLYDSNRDGFLCIDELSSFFNDFFVRIGDGRTYSQEEILVIFKQADSNKDGRIDKQELIRVLPLILSSKQSSYKVTSYVAPESNYQYKYYTTSRGGGSSRVVTTTYTTTTSSSSSSRTF